MPKISRSALIVVYECADTNGDGTLSVDEIKAILTHPVPGGRALSERAVDELIQRFDTNGDGLFSIEEFTAAFATLVKKGTGSTLDEVLAISKNLLSHEFLMEEQKKRIPEHLLNNGVILATNGWGMVATGGSMQWGHTLLIFDKSTGQVSTLKFVGVDHRVASFSKSKAADVSMFPLNVIESEYHAVTEAGRFILTNGPLISASAPPPSGGRVVSVDATDVYIVEADDTPPPGSVLTPVRTDARQVEYEPVLTLTTVAPAVRVFYRGQLLRSYTIEPQQSNPDLEGQFLHACIRLLGSGGVMMDGIVSRDRSNTPKHGYEGVRFQPLKLDGDESRFRGRGLFDRGLMLPVETLRGNVRLICVCDALSCAKSFTLMPFDAWNEHVEYFYAAEGKQTMTLPYRSLAGMPGQASTSWTGMSDWVQPTGEAVARLDDQLPGEPAGKFGFLNPLRCPHCAEPYIDFAAFPELRKSEYVGLLHINRWRVNGAELPARTAGMQDTDAASAAVASLPPAPPPPPVGKPVYAKPGSGAWDGMDWRSKQDRGPPHLRRLAQHTQQLRARLAGKSGYVHGTTAAAFCKADVGFPKPSGIKVNMMPFIYGIGPSALPEKLRHYWPLVEACEDHTAGERFEGNDHASSLVDEKGKTFYLTIMETSAKEAKGGPQRRGGMHTEGFLAEHTFGALRTGRAMERTGDAAGKFGQDPSWQAWGFGNGADHSGGVYMVSNVTNSTCVWNIELPREVGGASRLGGDCEHLRDELGAGHYLEAGELIWMTDATPHESVPLLEGTARSYFRLVTAGVGVWWAKHSTPNPLGTPPDCPIRHDDKFAAL